MSVIESNTPHGRLTPPTLRGNDCNDPPVTGCVGMKAGECPAQKGGNHVEQRVDPHLLSALSPRSGSMGALSSTNCGTKNPSNLGASSQTGGGCGCSSATAGYGFKGGNDLAVFKGSYPPPTPTTSCPKGVGPSVGGRRKKRRSKTRKPRRKSRRKMTRKRNGRKHRRTTKHKRRVRKRRSKTRKSSHRRRRQRGGYYQLGTNIPFSTGFSTPVAVSPANSALANPAPYKRYMISRDNYNHYTGKSTPVPKRSSV